MATISNFDAKPLFTKELVKIFSDRPTPTGFLSSFFEKKVSTAKNVSIEVRRNTEKVAVDVVRGTQGNRNQISRSSEKVYTPPYFREYLDATSLDWYDLLYGQMQTMLSPQDLLRFAEDSADELMLLRDKIERSYELQAAQVLLDGIVQLKNGDNIDYNRKAASKVDLGGANYWDQAGVNPIKSIKDGCQFLRKEGKVMGNEFNLIVGTAALDALFANDEFRAEADLRRIDHIAIGAPQRGAVGQTSHGRFSAGDYNVNLWSYDQYYNDADTDALTAYFDPKKFVLLPSQTNFVHSFAAVPMVVRNPQSAALPEMIQNVPGDYVIGNYIDPRVDTHVFDIKSAGLMTPVAVDQLYTAQVLA